MALQDEYIVVLREVLGEGFESAVWDALTKEYVLRSLKPQVLANRKAAVDDTVLVAARQAKEAALRSEESSRRDVEKALVTQLDVDAESF
jgi:hypothetical protein